MTPWVEWARTLASVAQNGLEYADNAYDAARYRDVRRVAAALLAAGGAGPAPRVLEVLERERGYATPKVDVRAYVAEQHRVLLVKEREDGRWTLPGGWADPTDLPSTAIEREVAEEAGYLVRARRLLACWDRSLQDGAPPYPFRVYKLFFACEIVGETVRDDTETEDVAWHDLAALPPLSLGRVTADQIARLTKLARDSTAPAAFD
jgi:ADP-ribose pyrophosphatase YjhB (NUDIX family)